MFGKLVAAAAAALWLALAPVTAEAAGPEDTLVMETTKGRVVIALRPDLAPQHVAQVKKLVADKFYDGIVFHRVIPGFMAQTGDPTGTGMGGSDLPDIPAEFSQEPFERGTVGMARAQDPNSANSQFFIMFDEGSFLNGQYTVWGEVTEGMDVIDQINKGEPPANPDKIVTLRLASEAN
ncbi:peptidylprolyl isomerase [Chthonobacter rhizosphaerae]|uniref:peptidylprolyl isomerase n=1 Tax=Chthonobacter rhizosphaerae TaxID=2735553 RepID=UPI0015EEDE3C|nr:peptidylprolyl isomerase [Chthonobacter rhizosphaerae]